ncbi:TraB/GumN family protein [Psychroserpens sp. NJDZ02]|uniref:TraB/GumN family protein n=1 Tax=Psychroserpens sp. NJDZ02 TaxID=2570561 RepID=UPI0010A75777|nr:TraB/GumN family protein [Psychroserpens sp. NJDZ02]QCE41070.1 TraB/GumN family protein [Psychroserpens sp. NJDZ02]
MKNHFLTFFCVISFVSFSQNKNKEQSLLWEISGNNLDKPSYIYGTMHVSAKVAFRLDDVFFEALENSESIALESDPSTWLAFNYETTTLAPQNYSQAYDKNFYSSLFGLEHPEEVAIRGSIRSDNRMINGYLYRKDGYADNFEEETYLDMFIYQAGKKKKKKIYSLEDIEESRYLVSKAQRNARKNKIDPWLTKLYEKENPYLVQENTYRDRNLTLLDSIGAASNTEFFRKNMLYTRNANMVHVMDSLMQSQTVFAGVGAAHLPGKKGLLKMLENKGYTVKPLVSKQSNVAQTKKEHLENYIAPSKLKTASTPDGFLTLKTFTELYEFYHSGQKYYISPDMTNGAYLTISRFNTFEYLPSEKEISLERLDNFLFEDIPGDIIKKEILKTPYPGISILNKTKKGDYQKYHIYKTPLEVVLIKFAGQKDYVLKNEASIFDSITFKTPSNDFETFTSTYNKYEVNFPKYHTTDNIENAGQKLIQGNIGEDYYFLKEVAFNDAFYIEEDKFEAKFIVTNFFKDFDIEDSEGSYNNNKYYSYEGIAKKDSTTTQNIHLKSIVKDGSYFLMGYVGPTKTKADDFFKTFKFKKVKQEGFEKITDTSLHFSVITNTKPIPPYNSYGSRNTKDYEEQIKRTTYYSKTNEQIFITKLKFHDLQMYKNVDSLWNDIDSEVKLSQDIDDFNKYIIADKKKYKKEDQYVYEYTLKDSLSAKAILVKNILKKGALFEIKSLTDTISQPSQFVTNFYDSFQPIDTLLGESVFSDKTERFFKALRDNDSIVFKARTKIKFNKSNASTMIDLIKNFEFPDNKEEFKTFLISELAQLEDPRTDAFLNTLYEESYSEPDIQNTILRSLLNKPTKKSYNTFLTLLDKDLPLSGSISSMFYNYKDSLQLKRTLFPALMEYTSIEEYREPIYELLARLKDSSIIKTKSYKKFKKQLITDGKIEVKRSLGSKSSYNYRTYSSSLYAFVKLIFPFRKEIKAKNFFDKLLDSDNVSALSTYYILLEEAGEPIPEKLKEKTIDDYKNQATLVDKMYRKKLYKPYLTEKISQEMYAKSTLFRNTTIEKERDSIHFLGKKEFNTDDDKKGDMYFYMLVQKEEKDETKRFYYAGFLKPEKPGRLQTKIYYESSYSGDYIDENQEEDQLIKDVLDLVIHKNRKRLNEGGY